MSTVELEIIERFNKLDSETRRRVLDTLKLTDDIGKKPTPREWLENARALRAEMKKKYGARHAFNSVDLLEEAYEERLNDIMGGR